MINEEMQKTMRFILEQQAWFVVHQEQANERIIKIENVISKIENVVLRDTNATESLRTATTTQPKQ